MSETHVAAANQPLVDSVTATFEHSGACLYCGRKCRRTRSFTSTSLENCAAKAERWTKAGIWHRKCGGS